MTKKKLNINLLVKCEKRFSGKKWYNDERREALLGRLEYLNDDETNLILDLTDRFRFLGLNEVYSELSNAFKKIPVSIFNGVNKILFAPLKSPYNKEEEKKKKRGLSNGHIMASKSKSCDLIFELMRIEYPARYMQPYKDKIKICYEPKDILDNYTQNSLIVLWDDFVGSGDTAFNAIADLQKFIYDEKGIKTLEKNFAIVCMAAMREGIDILNYCMLKCYASDVYIKAISDDQRFDKKQIEARISYMKSAETKVLKKSAKNFSLGYKQSEALVSILDKCPNNTFPFYWFDSKYQLNPVFCRRK